MADQDLGLGSADAHAPAHAYGVEVAEGCAQVGLRFCSDGDIVGQQEEEEAEGDGAGAWTGRAGEGGGGVINSQRYGEKFV